MINDENTMPFHPSAEASMSLGPSEPQSSPLVSNSFLYNLPDPTIGLPGSTAAADYNVLPSPFKRSAIAPLNKPLSREQTQQLEMHKSNVACAAHQLPSSAPRSPSKASAGAGSAARRQANLDAPGGLPTPPSSSEFLTTTPGPSNKPLTSLPREPVSPSPSRTRNNVLSPARATPTRASTSTSTPRATQRSSHSQSLRAGDDEDSDENDILRSASSLASSRMRSVPEVEEDSDDDEEEEEQEEEIRLISFKRGPDATFLREIKENGWDQPLPPSPIKFTYLEPDPPRPPRQSSVGNRARSQSRSKTPQIRASPAPSQASRASSRARSVRAPSAGAAEDADDLSNESIKSSGTALTHASRMSNARSIKSSSSRRSIARSSVAPPVVVADLTRDQPSLPDSPGDDPLLLTGPDTYIVYHDQTPSAKNRSTSRISKAASAQTDISMSMHSHSTPLPAAAAAAVSSQRRDSVASASSSASRNSLYTRMSGKQAADVSAFAAEDDEEDDSQRTENANQANADDVDAQEEDDDAGAAFLPFDDAGFASDSDQDEPVAFEAGASSPVTPPLEAAQPIEQDALEDISSMSDVSRSFADDSAAHERDQISGPVDVSAFTASDASDNHDDSAIVEQSLHVGLNGRSIDASVEVSGQDDSDVSAANDQSVDVDEGEQTMDQSAADETADATADVTEEISEEQAEPDVSVQERSVALEDSEESADLSAFDQSNVESAGNHTMDASVDNSSPMLSHNEQSQDASASLDNEDATVAEEDVADASMLADGEEGADRTNEGSRVSDQSMDARAAESSVVADTTMGSEVAQDSIGAADDSQAVDVTQESHQADSLEHGTSAHANVPSESPDKAAEVVEDDSIPDDSRMLGDDSNAQRADTSALPVDSTFGSIDLDASLSPSELSSFPAAPAIDGSLLPHPVVLLETPPEDSSAIVAWKAHQAGLDVSVDDDDDFTFEIEASVRSREAGDTSMADGIRSIAASLATPADEGSAMSRSESIASVLSSLHSADSAEQDDEEEKEEALRRKYQDSREITLNRRANLSRRLSLSTDSEAESDVDDQHSDAEQDDEEEELQDAEASRQPLDASRADSAHSLVEEDQTEEQDDEDEEDNENESALGDDAASSGEEHDDEDASDSEGEEDDEDNLESASEVECDASDSQLDESEQSGSLLDPVVIVSSSASPSSASTSALPSEDEEEEGEEYVVQVVRDPRDRSLRASEHSVIDDEPQIHTLHLRQPRPSLAADDTHRSQTLADASHSRSRVLKLGQATSTPIVEISSLDPRAAARATAILKLFHKYVDEGWISGAEMGDATEGRMRRVVDAIERADRQGRRLEDASELQQRSLGGTSEDGGADLTTLLMDAELSLAREGTTDTESFLGSRATSVASKRPVVASPATPFLPGGFRATPASTRPAAAADTTAGSVGGGRTASPSILAASRGTARGDTSFTSTVANNSKRKHPPTSSFTGLSTPDRTSTRRPAPAKQARLSTVLLPPTASTFNPRTWDTSDWKRLDKYFTCGVKNISSRLLSESASSRAAKADSYVEALLGIDIGEVAEVFLDEMDIGEERRVGEWEVGKVEARLLALQRKYLRKVESKYPEALRGRQEGNSARGGDESIATEDLEWSLNANTTAATQEPARSGRGGRVSFGTPYRMGAHSTPAVGLLKKATTRAAQASLYPPLPVSTPSTMGEEGVIGRASRLISRLSGGFSGLLSSPQVQTDKGKRKATEAELDASPAGQRRRVEADETVSTGSEGDSIVESLLLSGEGVRSTINASMFTDATSIRPDTSSSSFKTTGATSTTLPQPHNRDAGHASQGRTATTTVAHTGRASERRTATTTVPRAEGASASRTTTTTTTTTLPSVGRIGRSTTINTGTLPQPSRNAGRPSGGSSNNLTSSLQLAGGSSGVSHTPLSLLSPATHRVAAAKVEKLRQSRAERNWTSPRRQRAVARPGPAG